MATYVRRTLLVLLPGLLVAGAGCDLASLTYFIMPEAREPARLKNLGDPKKEPRVAIVSYTGLETRAEFIHADRQLCDLLGKHLKELCAANDDKVTVIQQRKVEEFKNSHPDWREMDLADLGKTLGADYVIYLEINALSLYEQGSLNQLFRGRAQINVSLVDVHHPDDTQDQEVFSCTYPTDAKGPVPVGLDMHPAQFRQQFMNYVAHRLSYYFERYPKRDSAYFAE